MGFLRKCFRYNSDPSYIFTCFRRHKHDDSQVDVMLNNSVLYNGMIHPFTRMAIKGVIWYQGKLYT